jgi:hypothetical protein
MLIKIKKVGGYSFMPDVVSLIGKTIEAEQRQGMAGYYIKQGNAELYLFADEAEVLK